VGLFRPYQPKTEAERASRATVAPTPPAPAGRPSPKGRPAVDAPVAARDATATERIADTERPADATTGAGPDRPQADRPAPTRAAAPAPVDEPAVAGTGRTTTVERPRPGQGKTAPTPTRKQALAARQERLNPVLTKKEQRQRDRAAQDKRRVDGLQQMHDKPAMTLIRDYVDCRWTIAEFLLPAVLLIIVIPLALGGVPQVMNVAVVVSFALYVGMIVDLALLWWGLRKWLRRLFPEEPLRGKLSYAASRAMLLRRWRRPPAVVKRGSKFVWPRQAAA